MRGVMLEAESPPFEVATVFENSAACATDELLGVGQSRPGSTSMAFGRMELEQRSNPVESEVCRTVYAATGSSEIDSFPD
jgi:hypothetical protein